MEIWNINPAELNHSINLDEAHYFNYNFLNIFNFNITPYYKIIKSLILSDLIKLYRYIYLRSIKLNKLYPKILNPLNPMNDINPSELNDILLSYINDDILTAIFILNSIELYGNY